MMPLLRNFDLVIVKAPKEGIMGLTHDKKPIVLHDGDMVSMNLLDNKFAEVMFTRGMLQLIRTRDPRQIKWENRGKLKIRRSRKNRGKKNGSNLIKWLGGGVRAR